MNVTMTSGIARAPGTNCTRNSVQFGSRPCSRSVARWFGEFRLACLLMSEGQNADHGPAGGAGREAGRERLEGSGVGLPGEELVAVDEPQQRHRLALQRVDDMPVVDDMTMLAMGMSSTSSQRHLRRTARDRPRGDRRRGGHAAGGR